MKITRRQLRRIIREEKKGLWANIHAKKARGEKSNPNSKSYKAAKKAGQKINRDAKREADSMYEAEDQNSDNVNDFDDVKIARMKASGMSDAEIKKKHPELFESRNAMKVTKRQIRQIIREEKARLLNEIHPRAVADNAYMDVLEAVDELHAALKRGVRVGVAPGGAEDELYIMTGGAEGITVKVLRRGR